MMASLAPLLLVLHIIVGSSASEADLSFTAKLIHRDSPESPFYNASLTLEERLDRALNRSMERYRSFGISPEASFSAPIQYIQSEYLMSFFIGTPPVPTIAPIDTGSDLTWLNCEPCLQCYLQKPPLFNPAKSSSYKNLPCSNQCKLLKESVCSSTECHYRKLYADKSLTLGLYATETFKIGSASLPNILFGCSHHTEGKFSSYEGGIVGLDARPRSLVSQLSPLIKGLFSYCLVSFRVRQPSTISFGMPVSGPGAVTTPLFLANPPTNYFVSLLSISVGSVGVSVPMTPSEGNIFIDSGSTFTYLRKSVLLLLEAELNKIVKLPKVTDRTYRVCFNVGSAAWKDSLPVFSFRFKGASVSLPPENTFIPKGAGVACLSLLEADRLTSSNVLGVLAQQNFHIGYDLVNRKVTFLPKDCSKGI